MNISMYTEQEVLTLLDKAAAHIVKETQKYMANCNPDGRSGIDEGDVLGCIEESMEEVKQELPVCGFTWKA